MITEAEKKQIPMPTIRSGGLTTWTEKCPECKKIVWFSERYCPNCGQRLQH